MVLMSYPNSIRTTLNEVVDEIVTCLNPDYVIFAGSFGKNAWISDGEQLLSDFELVFICQHKWSLKTKRKLLKRLNSKHNIEISLKGYLTSNVERKIISNYSFSSLGYLNLDFFDTFNDIQYLYKRNKNSLSISCESKEIPIWEAWRLLVNRIGALMEIELSGTIINEKYAWLKIYESIADAYLIVKGIYESNVSQRINLLNSIDFNIDSDLDEVTKKSKQILLSALKAREKHSLLSFKLDQSKKANFEALTSWLEYIQNVLAKKEFSKTEDSFSLKYLKDNKIQKKYLGINENYAIILSNFIRLLTKVKLVNSEFKFYDFRISWRHVILLQMATLFMEIYDEKGRGYNSHQVMKRLIRNKYTTELDKKDKMNTTLTYWKLLR